MIDVLSQSGLARMLVRKPHKIYSVGLLGAGTVGGGLIRLLTEDLAPMPLSVEIKRVGIKNLSKPRKFRLPHTVFTDDVDGIVSDPSLDIIVEAIGGLEPARSLIEKALRNRKHVVTANKYVISEAGDALQKLAQAQGRELLFEASVAGSIPVIEILNGQIIPDRIRSVHAILNGTTNFILTRMAEAGEDYEEALSKAQQLGFSEPDPSFDVSGKDASQKLAILISLLRERFCPPACINIRGIEFLKAGHFQFAAAHQMIIKPLSIYEEVEGRGFASVEPVLLPRHSVFANVRNEYNALMFGCSHIGRQFLIGKGAGELPTASAVLSDLRKIVTAAVEGQSAERECAEGTHRAVAISSDKIDAEEHVRFCPLAENPQRYHFYVSCSSIPDLSSKRKTREHFAGVGELIQEQGGMGRADLGLNIFTEKLSHADLIRLVNSLMGEEPKIKIAWFRVLQDL